MTRKLLLGLVFVAGWAGWSGRASAFCDPDGFSIPFGYSYCFSTNWFAPGADPWAANSDTDETDWDSNWIYAPDAAHAHAPATLLVFLPGHGSDADSYTNFLRRAQANGYYVIGLAYQNGKSIQSMCGYYSECAGLMLEQNVSGDANGFYASLEAGFPEVDNSINYRLGHLLDKLESQHIANNFHWRQFYDYTTGNVNWDKIVIAGHSEGGATATWITKNRSVIAGLVFEAPYSVLDNDSSDGRPTAGSGFTPFWAPDSTRTRSATTPVGYLHNDSSNWVNKLWITLNKFDRGYDSSTTHVTYTPGNDGVCTSHSTDASCSGSSCSCTIPTWTGLNMQAVGAALGKTEQTMSSAPASLNGHKWWTSTVQPTGGCSGHSATVSNGCYPSWMPTYWDQVLLAPL
jgi:hypothetical protein